MKPIEEFHAHIYFTPETIGSAKKLRDVFIAEGFTAGRLHEELRGPHTQPMFTVQVAKERLSEAVSFLMLNHDNHSVLLHPDSGNDLADHTMHAMWLGEKLALDLKKL